MLKKFVGKMSTTLKTNAALTLEECRTISINPSPKL